MTSLAAIEARLARLEARRDVERFDDARDYDWYALDCPCGLPPGDCVEHPRARAAQRPPEGNWRTWLMLAGRGWGKNQAASQWVRMIAESGDYRRLALVAPTAADIRDTVIEGDSGILACSPPWDRPRYEPSKRRLTWKNGAQALCFSAEEPERLRGPNFDAAFCDELGAWDKPKAWDMLMFALRLGKNPRVCIATTPRPTALLKSIIAQPTTVRTGGSTYDNRAHLAEDFFAEIISRYEGTRLGRQELHAEMLDITEGAWFANFAPAKTVKLDAAYKWGVPVYCAIDCGVSRWTAAVFFQCVEVEKDRKRINVFGDYIAEGQYSEQNALAIKAKAEEVCGGHIDFVKLDPASTARTGVGPAAFGEYQRVFGQRVVTYWPVHRVADGLDQIELMLDKGDLILHPSCTASIDAFNNYERASRGGEYQNYPAEVHPFEDSMDAIRGGIRSVSPEGRRPQPKWGHAQAGRIF